MKKTIRWNCKKLPGPPRRPACGLDNCESCNPEYYDEDKMSENNEAPRWVVVDAKNNCMRCRRCGDTESMDIIVGKRLDYAAGIMQAFSDAHGKCQPEPQM